MNRTADVLIIGGGVIGVCAAYSLLQRGREVTLLDRADICVGSSYGNAGLIVPSHAVPLGGPGVIRQALRWLFDASSPFYVKPRLDRDLLEWLLRFRAASTPAAVARALPILVELNQSSLPLFDRLASEEGLAFGFERRGSLHVFHAPETFDHGIHEAELLHGHGVEVAVLDAAGVQELVPLLKPGIVGGAYYREDAHLTPDRFVKELAALTQRRGAQIHAGTDVIALERAGGRVTRVVTMRGDFQAEQVVLATGAWSPALARSVGMRLPVQAAKGYSITIPRPQSGIDRPLILADRKVAVTPMVGASGARLRFAGTLELAGLDLSINQRRVEAIRQAAQASFQLESHEDDPAFEIWRGLRPLTPDTLPIIGRAPGAENLILATGHGMLGVSSGPMTGELVAQLITGETPVMTRLRFRR